MRTSLVKENAYNRQGEVPPIAQNEGSNLVKNLSPSLATPFADLMLKPELAEAALKTADANPPRKANRGGKPRRAASTNLKDTTFQLTAPGAGTVKLAADSN